MNYFGWGLKMKRQILNMLILILLLVGLPIVTGNISWASEPNEPEPESGIIDSQISYLSAVPNEPGSEGILLGDRISYLSEDPDKAEDNGSTDE